MTTTKTATSFPAGARPDSVIITPAGQVALDRAIFNQAAYSWDIIRLALSGPCIDDAEIVDSYCDLEDACWAAVDMNRREREKGIKSVFLVQRHPPSELPATIEF